MLGQGVLTGRFAVPADPDSLATLRTVFRPLAIRYGLDDLDTAALRDGRPRGLTRPSPAGSTPAPTTDMQRSTGSSSTRATATSCACGRSTNVPPTPTSVPTSTLSTTAPSTLRMIHNWPAP